MSDLLKPSKQPKVKKTLNELLGEGQVKTGKAVLNEAAKKAQEELFYLANFNEFKPQIRLYMESWYFAQHHELKRLERDDAGLIAGRKHANALLDKLMQLRKMQYALWAATPKALPMHSFKPPKEIDFRKD